MACIVWDRNTAEHRALSTHRSVWDHAIRKIIVHAFMIPQTAGQAWQQSAADFPPNLMHGGKRLENQLPGSLLVWPCCSTWYQDQGLSVTTGWMNETAGKPIDTTGHCRIDWCIDSINGSLLDYINPI